MADYLYDLDICFDPDNPNNIVRGGLIEIYDANDLEGTTLLALKDTSGLPLPNPMMSNEYGVIGRRIAPVPQCLWKSGPFSGVFNSYKGLRDEAVAARTAAEAVESMAAAGEFKGEPGPPGPKGFDGANVLPTDAAVEQAVLAGEKTAAALYGHYGTNTVLATVERFPTIDKTGVEDSAAGLQAALDATPDGGTLVIPVGTYKVDGSLTSVGKNVSVIALGATLIKMKDWALFDFRGGYSDPLPVVSLAEVTINDDTGGADPGTAITVADGPAWKRGDVVKVYADDVIPGGKPGSGGNESRVGKFLVVSNVTGNVINCLGRVDDPFTTAVRVARLDNVAAHIRGGVFITDQAGLDGSWASNMIQFRSMSSPTVRDVRIKSTPYAGFQFTGCYGYTVDSCDVDYAKNDSANGINGYGISDRSCSFGRVSNYRARRVRHGWTDGSPAIPANTVDPANYGRTYGAQISNSVAYGTANTGWDTHSWSENVTFTNCQSIDCYKGFNLRGRKHKVIDCAAIRCTTGGLNIFVEEAGGESWGHVVKNFIAENCPSRSLEVYLNPTGHPNANVNEPRMSYIDGFFIRQGGNDSVWVRAGNVRIDNLHYIAAPTLPDGGRLFYVRNARVEGGGWVQDLRQVTAGAGFPMLRIEAGGSVDIGTWDYVTTAENASRVTYALEVESSTIAANVKKLTMSHPPGTFISNAIAEGSRFDWEYLSSGDNSGFFSVSDASISSTGGGVATISRTKAPVIFARLNAAAGPQTMPAFRSGAFRGQILRLWNVSTTNNVTIPHGTATYKTFLKSGAATVLTPNQQIQLVWIGTTWWEF